MKRVSEVEALEEADRSLALLNLVRGTFPAVAAATLKTVLNAWCTAGNFSNEEGICVFCGLENSDHLNHFSHCEVLSSTASKCFKHFLPCVDRHLVAIHELKYVNACFMYIAPQSEHEMIAKHINYM